ncbi:MULTISPECIES: fluoride efflux transporter CrcB [Salinibacter]|jgi:CrcB protein|uniref:fluoride efflux transporter CrcB n=2 Tax=Salinibacteraceae TaxID=1853225 RepID=UPI001ABAB541|nr:MULTISPECIES: fluoride efflux transporter CrcB [Salinibacter]
MMKLLWIAFGGSLGALSRHGLSVLAHRLLPSNFPWGTLAANLSGCFLIGGLWVLAAEYSFSQEARLFVFTGGIGSLTTFSTYGLESLMLLREGRIVAGLGNVLLSTVLGLVLVAIGAGCALLLLGEPVAAFDT